MPVQLNHTIAHAHDPAASARFLSEMLGLGPPTRFGPFDVVELDNGASIDFIQAPEGGQVLSLHYAFLVSETEFDEIHARILERGLDHWADPGRQQLGQVNHHDGGRGVYWADPNDHILEIITVPYEGWPT